MTPSYFKNKHGYEIDGSWYPRVTSICKIIHKPGLEVWLANQKSFAHMKRKRKKLTDWGTLIHETVENILLGRLPKIDPEIQPSINAFLEWFREHKVDVEAVEKRVVSAKHFYSGTLDVVAEVNGKLGVLDIKTGSNIWDDYFIQTAAYLEAYNEKSKNKAQTHWVLRIDQFQECASCGAKRRMKSGVARIKGGKKKCSHEWSAPKGDFEFQEVEKAGAYRNAFLAAKNLWEFSNRELLSRIENYPNRENVISDLEQAEMQF
ncbi:MAG: hypothetical protein GF370_00630 [Candidatus Nealsonbacteria bacterium]|nr:hypothetical protein [Candidatus Nealsonbacteria bacterium]